MSEVPQEIKRWATRRKAEVVTENIKGRTTASEVAQTLGLTIGEVGQWMGNFIHMGTEALLGHFGTLHNSPPGILLGHDNGLVFGSRSFRQLLKIVVSSRNTSRHRRFRKMNSANALLKFSKKSFFGATVSDQLPNPASRWWDSSSTTIPLGRLRPLITKHRKQKNQKLCKIAA